MIALLEGPLPPVDPRNLEQMRQAWDFIKIMGPAAVGAGLLVLREWVITNRKDQAAGTQKNRGGKPDYK